MLRVVGELGKAYRYGQLCLRCGYCQPCPQGIDAPAIFRAAEMARELEQRQIVVVDEIGKGIRVIAALTMRK